MEIVNWIALAVAAIGLGATFEEYLTVHPLKMSRYLFVASLLLAGVCAGIVWGFDGVQRLAAAGVALVAALAGYAIMTKHFLAREDERPVPGITRAKDDPGLGHTAVVYFTHGEPETYDPIGWINQFREFDEQKIPFVPLLVRPLFAYNLRKKYLAVGRSNHRQTHMRMIRMLEEAYRAEGDTTHPLLSVLPGRQPPPRRRRDPGAERRRQPHRRCRGLSDPLQSHGRGRASDQVTEAGGLWSRGALHRPPVGLRHVEAHVRPAGQRLRRRRG